MCKKIWSNITNWWGGADVNHKRVQWGRFYFIVGLFLLVSKYPDFLFIFSWIHSHWVVLSWIFGWSCIGISAGLINSRTNQGKDKNGEVKNVRVNQDIHYIVYYGFAFFVSSLASYSFAFSRADGVLDYPKSALIALTLGFAADRICDLVTIK